MTHLAILYAYRGALYKIKWGIFKSGNLQNGESLNAGIFKMGNLKKHLPISQRRTRILWKILCLWSSNCSKSRFHVMVIMPYQAVKQPRNVLKAFWKRKRVKSFEIWSLLQGVFLFTVFSFLRICSSVKHASLCTYSHITVFMFLHVQITFNQDLFSAKSCLMSFVKPSHAFKLKSVLNSSATVCLDKAVYFMLEQTKKLSHSLRFVRKGIAATKHVDQNKESATEIY